ncbi:uncharacterized protein LOC116181900 [Photinus pyralis]|nr:uncharacterized protein LOC116181900 [Photinus pyralis]
MAMADPLIASKENNLPLILNGEFFKILMEEEADPLEPCAVVQITAKCMLCAKHTVISSTKNSTGNFHKHLRRKHPRAVKKFDSLKEHSVKLKRSNTVVTDGSTKRIRGNEGEDRLVSTSFATPFDRCKNTKLSENKAQELICSYIIDEMLPIYKVEKESFRRLVSGLSGGIKPPCRRTLTNLIVKKKDKYVTTLKTKLDSVQYVCTTTDIWSSNNRSYLGMTCHYFDANLIRCSSVLACRRMRYSHTHLEIGRAVSDIHKEYNLKDSQIVGTVTDNAANFGKAFKIFSAPDNLLNIGDLDFLIAENLDIDINTIPDFIEIEQDFQNNLDLEDSDITLPRHFRCASHTLNLIATKDAETALLDSGYKKIYNSTFAKLTAIWNISHRSTAAADEIENICKLKLLVPCPTRWNSLFDSVQRILQLREHLETICEKLKKPKLKNIELEFLSEYALVMEVLAKSIDILQGEESCCLGYLLPTLFQIKKTLNSLSHLVFCTALKDAILDGVNKRYKDILNLNSSTSKPYILATVSIPKFKLKWITSTTSDVNLIESTTKLIKSLFITECEKASKRDTAKAYEEESGAASAGSEDDDFFDILKSPLSPTSSLHLSEKEYVESAAFKSIVEMECLRYFQDKSKDKLSLLNYPLVMKVYKIYNTILPSSAPVERLFSTAGQILTPKRNRLSDEMFEILLLLRHQTDLLQ